MHLSIPKQAPLMVLPEMTLFPHALVPLRIFEPRYRAMLEWTLERERVFCLATRRPSSADARTPADFLHIAGLGLVRASVIQDDGTSHLLLQGIVRVQMTGFTQEAPFFIADVEPLESEPTEFEEGEPLPPTTARLIDKVRNACERFVEKDFKLPDGAEEFLAQVRDPDLFADTVAHAFLRNPTHRQDILEEPRVEERLALLLLHLEAELRA